MDNLFVSVAAGFCTGLLLVVVFLLAKIRALLAEIRDCLKQKA